MQITSTIVDIPKTDNPSTEYIESELKKLNIVPLRWAIVDINEKNFTINCAFSK